LSQLKAGAADGFLARPDPAVKAVLIYGPDAGLVRERARRLVRAVAGDPPDPFLTVELSAEQLREDAARLADEVAALSLVGGRRLVRIAGASGGGGREEDDDAKGKGRGGRGLAAALGRLLEDGPWADTLVLLEAGDLPKSDRLRRLCEGDGPVRAIACFQDDSGSIEDLARSVLGSRGVEIEPQALEWLGEHLGSDRLATRGELEKLALYKGRGGGTVTLDDALASVGDGSPLVLDDVAFAAAGGERAELDAALQRGFAAGESPVAVLRIAARHLLRLQLAAARVAAGEDPARAMQSTRPPVFWRRQPAFRQQLRQWTPDRLAKALALVLEAEIDCKTTGLPAEAICGRALFRVAQAAAAGRR